MAHDDDDDDFYYYYYYYYGYYYYYYYYYYCPPPCSIVPAPPYLGVPRSGRCVRAPCLKPPGEARSDGPRG